MSHVDEETHRRVEGKSAVRVVNAHQSKVFFIIAISTYTDSTFWFSCLMEKKKKQTKASEYTNKLFLIVSYFPCTPPRGVKVGILTYIYLHKLLRKIKVANLQSPGWQPTLHVSWCLFWWFESIEKKCGCHTKCPYWDQVSLSNTTFPTQ